ncbi:MAG TPA: hypothetical protein VGK73_16385, partial [Polyangiaceae bacterium]
MALTAGCAVQAELEEDELEVSQSESAVTGEVRQNPSVTPVGPIFVDPPLIPRCGLRIRPLLPIAFRFDGGNNQGF